MTSLLEPAHKEALYVIQQAVSDLASWSGVQLRRPSDTDAMKTAKKYLLWATDGNPKPLQSLFDYVHL